MHRYIKRPFIKQHKLETQNEQLTPETKLIMKQNRKYADYPESDLKIV